MCTFPRSRMTIALCQALGRRTCCGSAGGAARCAGGRSVPLTLLVVLSAFLALGGPLLIPAGTAAGGATPQQVSPTSQPTGLPQTYNSAGPGLERDATVLVGVPDDFYGWRPTPVNPLLMVDVRRVLGQMERLG